MNYFYEQEYRVSEVVVVFQTYLLAITLLLTVMSFGRLITLSIGQSFLPKENIEYITSNLLAGLATIVTISTAAAATGIPLRRIYIVIGLLAFLNLVWCLFKERQTLNKEFLTLIFAAPLVGLWGILPAIYFSARNGSGLTMIAKGNNDVANYAAVANEFLKTGFKNSMHYLDFNLNEFALRSDYRGPTSVIAAFSAITNLKTWQVLTAVLVFTVGFAVLGLIRFLTTAFVSINLQKATIIAFIVYSTSFMIYIQTNYFLAQLFATAITSLVIAHFISLYRTDKGHKTKNFDTAFLTAVSVYFYPHLLIPIFALSLVLYIVIVVRGNNAFTFPIIRNQFILVLIGVLLTLPYIEYLFAFVLRQLGASTAGWPLPLISVPGLLILPQLIGLHLPIFMNALLFIASALLIIHFQGRQLTVLEKRISYSTLIFALLVLSLLVILPGRSSFDYSFWKMESYLFSISLSVILVLLFNNQRIGQGVMFFAAGAVICVPTVSWYGNSFYGMYVSKDLSQLGSNQLITSQQNLNLKLQPYFETMAAGSIIEGPKIRNLSEGYWPVSTGTKGDCTLFRNDNAEESYIFKINNTFGLSDNSLSGCGATKLAWENGDRLYFSSASWSRLGIGWSTPEEWGTWTNGKIAFLNLPAGDYTKGFQLEFGSIGFLAPGKDVLRATVFIEKMKVGELKYNESGTQSVQIISIPAQPLSPAGKIVRLRFNIEKPISPSSIGASSETRELGIGLISIRKIRVGVN